MTDRRAPKGAPWLSQTGNCLLDLTDGRPASIKPGPQALRRYTEIGRRSVGTSVQATWPAAARWSGSFRALDIPADSTRSCFLLTLTTGSLPLGDARSGSHLEAIHSSMVAGAGYRVYLFRDRTEHGLPNQRLALLGSRLGWPELPPTAFTGGALITGTRTGTDLGDIDVPLGILTAALSAHLLPRPRPTDENGRARLSRPEESDPADAGVPLMMEVVTLAGQAVPVEFLIAGASVEIWHHEGAAVINRAVLRDWLADPGNPLAMGSAAFCFARDTHPEGRVALILPDVGAWILPPRVLHQLRSQL